MCHGLMLERDKNLLHSRCTSDTFLPHSLVFSVVLCLFASPLQNYSELGWTMSFILREIPNAAEDVLFCIF